MLRFWIISRVKMMSLHHGWECHSPQTASCIHMRHMKCVWAHWYAVNGHMAEALNSYTHTTWLRIWGSGGHLCLWSQNNGIVIVNGDSHLKLLPASILDIIYSVWAHWYAVHGHTYIMSLKQLYPHHTTCGSEFGVRGHLWSQNDDIIPLLRMTSTSTCFPHPYSAYSKCFSTLICCPRAYGSCLTQLYPHF